MKLEAVCIFCPDPQRLGSVRAAAHQAFKAATIFNLESGQDPVAQLKTSCPGTGLLLLIPGSMDQQARAALLRIRGDSDIRALPVVAILSNGNGSMPLATREYYELGANSVVNAPSKEGDWATLLAEIENYWSFVATPSLVKRS